MDRASKSQASFTMSRTQVHISSKIGFKIRNVAVGSPRPEDAKSGSGKSGIGVPNTAIRISIRKAGRRPINSRDVEGRRGGSMRFEHVSDAGGGVVVLSGEQGKEGLRLVVQRTIVTKLGSK